MPPSAYNTWVSCSSRISITPGYNHMSPPAARQRAGSWCESVTAAKYQRTPNRDEDQFTFHLLGKMDREERTRRTRAMAVYLHQQQVPRLQLNILRPGDGTAWVMLDQPVLDTTVQAREPATNSEAVAELSRGPAFEPGGKNMRPKYARPGRVTTIHPAFTHRAGDYFEYNIGPVMVNGKKSPNLFYLRCQSCQDQDPLQVPLAGQCKVLSPSRSPTSRILVRTAASWSMGREYSQKSSPNRSPQINHGSH